MERSTRSALLCQMHGGLIPDQSRPRSRPVDEKNRNFIFWLKLEKSSRRGVVRGRHFGTTYLGPLSGVKRMDDSFRTSLDPVRGLLMKKKRNFIFRPKLEKSSRRGVVRGRNFGATCSDRSLVSNAWRTHSRPVWTPFEAC